MAFTSYAISTTVSCLKSFVEAAYLSRETFFPACTGLEGIFLQSLKPVIQKENKLAKRIQDISTTYMEEIKFFFYITNKTSAYINAAMLVNSAGPVLAFGTICALGGMDSYAAFKDYKEQFFLRKITHYEETSYYKKIIANLLSACYLHSPAFSLIEVAGACYNLYQRNDLTEITISREFPLDTGEVVKVNYRVLNREASNFDQDEFCGYCQGNEISPTDKIISICENNHLFHKNCVDNYFQALIQNNPRTFLKPGEQYQINDRLVHMVYWQLLNKSLKTIIHEKNLPKCPFPFCAHPPKRFYQAKLFIPNSEKNGYVEVVSDNTDGTLNADITRSLCIIYDVFRYTKSFFLSSLMPYSYKGPSYWH